jgi:excisionase family DNA binding protein
MPCKLMTAEEVASELQVRPGTIRLWARQGLIPSVRLSHKVRRFQLDDVIAALKSAKERRATR